MVETDAGPQRPPQEAATPGVAPPAAEAEAQGRPEAPPEGMPTSVFMVTPNEWVHLDLSGDPLANARRLVDRMTQGLPDDKRKAKLRLAAALQGAVRDAVRKGAVLAAFYSQVVEGQTVGASAIVAARALPREVVRDGRIDMAKAVQSVAGALEGRDELIEAGPVDLPAGPAFRIHKTQVATTMGERRETVVVQYFLPVPGRLAAIVATFSTPSVEVAGSMIALFDAMASSLRWRA